MAYYATRTQQIAVNVQEHQLLKFGSKAERDGYCQFKDAVAITAAAARKLMIADVWRSVRSVEANCVFHVARYVA